MEEKKETKQKQNKQTKLRKEKKKYWEKYRPRLNIHRVERQDTVQQAGLSSSPS